jgi:hypothetical protein
LVNVGKYLFNHLLRSWWKFQGFCILTALKRIRWPLSIKIRETCENSKRSIFAQKSISRNWSIWIYLKKPGFKKVIILICFGSFRFTKISFRSVSFHDLMIFLTFRFVSFQKNIVSFCNVSWTWKLFSIPFRFVSENYAFLAFCYVSFRS